LTWGGFYGILYVFRATRSRALIASGNQEEVSAYVFVPWAAGARRGGVGQSGSDGRRHRV